jgi:asparagine synthase (glutamine-hydrolysing)
MCGIAGVVGTRQHGVVNRMTAALRHRGPDGEGVCSRGAVHLGATRLGILDPLSGPQPLYADTGDVCIVFNGEIYNHRELRSELQRQGHVFRTGTDTEVVLRLYEALGIECVNRLQGMFAFAILDGQRLWLARDRLGIKPLYYTVVSEPSLFVFGSEVKAILQCRSVTPRLNRQALVDMVAVTHPVDGDTFFEGIHLLPPGHTLCVTAGDRMSVDPPQPYYTRHALRSDDLSFDDALDQLEAVLTRAVETHLSADVDVGLTLSGGLDSSVLAMLARQQRERPLLTFTVGDHATHPDVEEAARVAAAIRSEHRVVLVGFEDMLDAVPAVITAEEKPTNLGALPFYVMCREIARRLKACIHGEGSDELFGGYEEYLDRAPRSFDLRRRLLLLRQRGMVPSPRAIEIINRFTIDPQGDEYVAGVFDVHLNDALEQHHLLPVDKVAMAVSLEMRVPYLDDAVVALGKQLPLRFLVRSDLGVGKYILRRLALKRFRPELLDVVLRQKIGFPSAGHRLMTRFDRLCEEMLPDSYVTSHEFGSCFPTKRQLMTFDLFTQIFMEGRGEPGAVGPVMDFICARAGRPTAGGDAAMREYIQ